MSVQIWTFVFVFLTFGLYIGIAVWSRAGSTSEFYVAGGGVPPLANGMATAADWMSAASFISMAGLISFLGRDGTFYPYGLDRRLRIAGLCYLLLICGNLANLPCRISSATAITPAPHV
jgi:Na+(H+)/acetate symporter ActP